MKKVKIICDNNGAELVVEIGTSLLELVEKFGIKQSTPTIAAYVNNRVRDLNYEVYENKSVLFIDSRHFEGARVYNRTQRFMLQRVTEDLFGSGKTRVLHKLHNDIYFEIDGVENSTQNCEKILKGLEELSGKNITITRDRIYHQEAAEIYQSLGMSDKCRQLNSSPSLYVTMNSLEQSKGYFYGVVAPSTGYIKGFDIHPLYKGFKLSLLDEEQGTSNAPSLVHQNMFEVLTSHNQLLDVLGVSDIGALNIKVNDKQCGELIKIGEAFQERNFASLASQVYDKCKKGVKLVLISGPSSSGKTTFSNRLNIQLRIYGLKPIILSMDNYFVDREFTPKDEKGNYDFEKPEAVDIELFNSHLSRLIAGERVEMPRYDFTSGVKMWNCEDSCTLGENNILIIEGIHALNPIMTKEVAESSKFKIFVSPLTSISLDNFSRVDMADLRLIRRIVRDSSYRSHTAMQTIKRWGSVRRGEQNYIFPYLKDADAVFNTFLFFELSVLKRYIEPLLKNVPDIYEEFSQADRLLDILSYFVATEDKYIPPTSIIREFIGGSSFKY